MKLAQQAGAEPLKSMLEESAFQYLRAADEIRTLWRSDIPCEAADRSAAPAADDASAEDIVASWERAECEALTYFRDAYDGELPAPLADTVRRHYEAGISRLERLRSLRRGRRQA